MFLRLALADHAVIVIMQFLQRAWLWSRELLSDMPNSDMQMLESERNVPFLLLAVVIGRLRSVVVRRIVVEARYSPELPFAVVSCTVLIDWRRLDVAGWYPYDFSTRDI